MDETNIRRRMEVEHCVRGDGEEIRNFLHRIKKIVDKGWPDDMEGIVEADRAAERQAQRRQRRQRYIHCTLRGLRPRYLQRKAQEYLMEHPNATWNDFSTRIIQRDVSYQVSSDFLNDEEQIKVQLASLGQQMKNLRSEQQEHRVIALENPRLPDPNRFCTNKLMRGNIYDTFLPRNPGSFIPALSDFQILSIRSFSQAFPMKCLQIHHCTVSPRPYGIYHRNFVDSR